MTRSGARSRLHPLSGGSPACRRRPNVWPRAGLRGDFHASIRSSGGTFAWQPVKRPAPRTRRCLAPEGRATRLRPRRPHLSRRTPGPRRNPSRRQVSLRLCPNTRSHARPTVTRISRQGSHHHPHRQHLAVRPLGGPSSFAGIEGSTCPHNRRVRSIARQVGHLPTLTMRYRAWRSATGCRPSRARHDLPPDRQTTW